MAAYFIYLPSITGQEQEGVAAGLPQATVSGTNGAKATSGPNIQELGVQTRSILHLICAAVEGGGFATPNSRDKRSIFPGHFGLEKRRNAWNEERRGSCEIRMS